MKAFLRQIVGWLLSCVFGFIGGYFYSHSQFNQEPRLTTLRSSRFELIDSTGKVVAFWGTDKGNNSVLAFLQNRPSEGGSQLPTPAASQTRFTEQNPDEAFAVGMLSTHVPFMNLLASDGTSRALLYLTEEQKPIFNMSDERSESRLELGFIRSDVPAARDDDWALRFRAPDVAGIGSMKDPTDHKYRGYFSVERNPIGR
jgi:hypothetical protein